ncbi:disulfide bond formation protein B [Bacillus shivajii]|uniref:disulfide oxidoreductase n=1 Tax=Bacillus shivajii TaxID=1983719 RepID=UPI001CFB33FA|nr:disulfide oxidoreductase [Bacillus shivajii]UCZ52062.1 disulfide bond formation protein B [Bacillus shivajii]
MEEKNQKQKIENLMFISWAIAFIGTIGSLYFSEVRHYIPCELCWVQRIFMYPLAITLAIAVIRKDAKQAVYTLPLSLLGAGFSLYHYLQQKIPVIGENSGACGIIPCTHQYINWLGFITIPFLAFMAFISISLIMVWIIKTTKE